jgi:hypothetical protein
VLPIGLSSSREAQGGLTNEAFPLYPCSHGPADALPFD